MTVKIRTFAVAALCASLASLPATAQNTNTIEYWSNHGNPAFIDAERTSILPCINVGFVSNAPAITDGSATNYAEFTSVLSVACRGIIRTAVVGNVATQDVPAPTAAPARYAGFYIADVTNIADVNLLNNLTLRLYDDGVPVKTVTGSNLLTLALLGGATRGFVYTDVSVPFDEVELQLGSLASALSNMDVYYAFATAGTGPFDPVDVPLSLENTALSAKATSEGSVKLTWDIQPAEKRTMVVVERSVEGGGMMPLATMPGAASTYTDDQPLTGQTNFYRLRVRNEDGSIQYSPTMSVFVKGTGTGRGWGVYPNPTADVLYVRASGGVSDFTATLRDATGRQVYRYESHSNEAQHRVWDKASAPTAPGVYFLEIETPAAGRWHQRVVLR